VHPHTLRQLQIDWLGDCPTLDRDRAKRTPVIIVSPVELLKHARSDVVVVAMTSSSRS